VTIHGKNTGVAVANYDLTRWLNQVQSGDSVDLAESSCFDEPEGSKVYVAGLRDGTASWSGRFTSEVSPLKNVKDVFDDIDAAGDFIPVTLGVDRGFVRGRACTMGLAYSVKLGVSSPISDVVSVTGDLQAQGGFRAGVILTDKPDVTATTTYSSVDGGAATTLGGFANLHVDARSTYNGNVVVKVQHSTDNAVFTDLITFSSVAPGVGSGQRVDLADDAVINRYVRVLATLDGTAGAATIRVALSRRK
jgi:hypothetical protein